MTLCIHFKLLLCPQTFFPLLTTPHRHLQILGSISSTTGFHLPSFLSLPGSLKPPNCMIFTTLENLLGKKRSTPWRRGRGRWTINRNRQSNLSPSCPAHICLHCICCCYFLLHRLVRVAGACMSWPRNDNDARCSRIIIIIPVFGIGDKLTDNVLNKHPAKRRELLSACMCVCLCVCGERNVAESSGS